jgi:hypothetical protein
MDDATLPLRVSPRNDELVALPTSLEEENCCSPCRPCSSCAAGLAASRTCDAVFLAATASPLTGESSATESLRRLAASLSTSSSFASDCQLFLASRNRRSRSSDRRIFISDCRRTTRAIFSLMRGGPASFINLPNTLGQVGATPRDCIAECARVLLRPPHAQAYKGGRDGPEFTFAARCGARAPRAIAHAP